VNDIKRALTLFVISSILVGCSPEQSPTEEIDSSAAHKHEEIQKNINQKFQKETSESPQPAVPPAIGKAILDVPLISQNPELKYGCEVTSLAMVLQHAGIKVNKIELANNIKKDNDRLIIGKGGDVIHWGNPKDGFVGDMTGKNQGYAVYVQPLQELMERYLPGRTVNLTGKSFDDVLSQIKRGKPVVVWTTGDYTAPKRWDSWNHGSEQIKATKDLHAVVLTGFEPGYVYLNDPLTVKKGNKVNQQTFMQSWNALGKQALSYR
jgi:uncharacterized protein YvpB